MKVVRSEYSAERNKPIVWFFTRDKKGVREIVKSQASIPYFYAPKNETGKLRGLRVDPQPFEAVDGTPVSKVYVNLPEDVPKIRDIFTRHWEADVLYPIRTLIDEVDDIEPTIPKIMFLDIEVDGIGRVPDPHLAQEQIIAISVHDNISDTYTTFTQRSDVSTGTVDEQLGQSLHEINFFRSESEMIEHFVQLIEDDGPDIISGWNVLNFDLLYLVNRMRRLGISVNKLSPMGSTFIRERDEIIIKGIALIDLMTLYRRFTENLEESYTLDYIGKKVTGRGKMGSGSNIRWLWKTHLDDLVAYNTNDVLLCVEIDKKLKLFEFLDELRRLCFCQYEDCMATSKMADSYILKMFHNRKVFPTKTKGSKREAYEGAFVGSWARGVYENVVAFDLKSLYPNLAVSAGLSPETIINDSNTSNDSITIDGVSIRTDIKGFLPEVIEHLFNERTRYKKLLREVDPNSDEGKVYDQRQKAIKTLLNALYGQTAFPHSRIYSPKIAKTITFLGRSIIHWTKDKLEDWGYKALYADTDGIYYQIDDIDVDYINRILKLLNDTYDDFVKQFGITSHTLEIEFEKIYRRAFFGLTKKRYAAHVIYKDGREVDEVQIMGFEQRRSDSAQFSRNLQKELFDMLLRQDKTKDEVVRYVGDQIDRIRKGNFKFTEIGLPKGINKDLSEYGKIVVENGVNVGFKGVPAHVRGAKYSKQNLNIELTNKPKMLYISKMSDDYPPTDVLCFDEDNQVPPGTEINAELTLNKLVKDKIESIFQALGWRMSELNPFWKGKAPPQGNQESLGNLQSLEDVGQVFDFFGNVPQRILDKQKK